MRKISKKQSAGIGDILSMLNSVEDSDNNSAIEKPIYKETTIVSDVEKANKIINSKNAKEIKEILEDSFRSDNSRGSRYFAEVIENPIAETMLEKAVENGHKIAEWILANKKNPTEKQAWSIAYSLCR